MPLSSHTNALALLTYIYILFIQTGHEDHTEHCKPCVQAQSHSHSAHSDPHDVGEDVNYYY
jgi:hypothetical protein